MVVTHFRFLGQDGKAFRLQQLAMIFIFTLRQPVRIPEIPGRRFSIHERDVIDSIFFLKKMRFNKLRKAREDNYIRVSPHLRDPALRIGIVTVCAYPDDHPINLKVVFFDNR